MYPESKAENINKLEKDLLNILSEIQTPQLHQQVILIFLNHNKCNHCILQRRM